MGFDQYHEPPEELSQETRTKARMFASLTEEAEAINWYEQRLSLEQDPEAIAVIRDAMHEEYKHFSMDLEFLFRRLPEVAHDRAGRVVPAAATSSRTPRSPRPRVRATARPPGRGRATARSDWARCRRRRHEPSPARTRTDQ